MAQNRVTLPPGRKGQSLTETVILLPLFLLLIFAIVQTCHLGIALAIVNYGASAVARQAVQQNSNFASSGQARFNKLMMAGMKPLQLHGVAAREENSSQTSVTSNMEVTACAELPAYPFVGQLLDKALSSPAESDPCGGTKSLGPVSLKGPAPFHFIVHGQARARMNYTRD